MELIRTKDALVRLVINVLVIDLFSSTITAGQYHGIVTGGQTISSNDEDSIVVHSGLSSAADVDIDILLKQLKSELARGVFMMRWCGLCLPTTILYAENDS